MREQPKQPNSKIGALDTIYTYIRRNAAFWCLEFGDPIIYSLRFFFCSFLVPCILDSLRHAAARKRRPNADRQKILIDRDRHRGSHREDADYICAQCVQIAFFVGLSFFSFQEFLEMDEFSKRIVSFCRSLLASAKFCERDPIKLWNIEQPWDVSPLTTKTYSATRFFVAIFVVR